MPIGIHEISNPIDSTYGQQREGSATRNDYIDAGMVGTFRAAPENAENAQNESDMWDDVRDESPVRSNGQKMRVSVGMNDEYVDWLETTSKQ